MYARNKKRHLFKCPCCSSNHVFHHASVPAFRKIYDATTFFTTKHYVHFLILNAPDGHFATASIIAADAAFSTCTHGCSLGLNTAGKFFTQFPECMHFPACHTTVTSPLLYSLMMFFVSILLSFSVTHPGTPALSQTPNGQKDTTA